MKSKVSIIVLLFFITHFAKAQRFGFDADFNVNTVQVSANMKMGYFNDNSIWIVGDTLYGLSNMVFRKYSNDGILDVNFHKNAIAAKNSHSFGDYIFAGAFHHKLSDKVYFLLIDPITNVNALFASIDINGNINVINSTVLNFFTGMPNSSFDMKLFYREGNAELVLATTYVNFNLDSLKVYKFSFSPSSFNMLNGIEYGVPLGAGIGLMDIDLNADYSSILEKKIDGARIHDFNDFYSYVDINLVNTSSWTSVNNSYFDLYDPDNIYFEGTDGVNNSLKRFSMLIGDVDNTFANGVGLDITKNSPINSSSIYFYQLTNDYNILVNVEDGDSNPVYSNIDFEGNYDTLFSLNLFNKGVFSFKDETHFSVASDNFGDEILIYHLENNGKLIKLSQYDAASFEGYNLFIKGSRFVPNSTTQIYSVIGDIDNIDFTNTYFDWTYSGDEIWFISTDSNGDIIYSKNAGHGDSIEIYFDENATAGTLTCKISGDGVPNDTISMNIELNNNTYAGFLEPLSCIPIVEKRVNTYINSFEILNTNFKNIDNGADSTGYTDYSSIGTQPVILYWGETLRLKATAGGIEQKDAYFGVWIDYNNNGSFADDGEFVDASTTAGDGYLSTYIQIPDSSEYDDLFVTRLRIKVRPQSPVTSADSCKTVQDKGEIEDYLVSFDYNYRLSGSNLLTPNDDSKNDIFIIHGALPGADNELKVFDRLGQLVYNKKDYKNQWDGKDNKNTLLAPGTYFYVFRDGDDIIKGFVELLY